MKSELALAAEEVLSLTNKEQVSREICSMTLDEDQTIFTAMRDIEKALISINVFTNPKSVQYFIQLVKRFGALTKVNGALQRVVNTIDEKAEDLFSATERAGITPDYLAMRLIELTDSEKENVKLHAVKMGIAIQLEKDHRKKFLPDKQMKKANVEDKKEENNVIDLQQKNVLKDVMGRIKDQNMSDFNIEE